MLQICYNFGAALHGVAESGTQTAERAHDDTVRSPVSEGSSREHHQKGRSTRLDGIDDAGQLPLSKFQYFRFWRRFTSDFDGVSLPILESTILPRSPS